MKYSKGQNDSMSIRCLCLYKFFGLFSIPGAVAFILNDFKPSVGESGFGCA